MSDESSLAVSVTNCELGLQDVESLVDCESQVCSVVGMKNATTDPDSESQTVVPILNTLNYFPESTIGYIRHASKQGSTFLEWWLSNPNADFTTTTSFEFTNLSKLDAGVFSRNLEVAYNSFWQSTYGSQYLTGNLSTDLSIYNNISADKFGLPLYFNSSNTLGTQFDGNEYHVNMGFATVLVIISFLLLVQAVASVVFRSLTLAPDILGYVSSFTRDNPYLEPNGASHFDGLERARSLQSLRITIGDVNPGSDVGHIALTASEGVQRLRKNKLYD